MGKLKIGLYIALITFLIVTIGISNISYAANKNYEVPDSGPGKTDDTDIGSLNMYRGRAGGTNSPKVKTMAQNVLGAIQIVGVVVSVVTLMIIGIKYMFASLEEKADYKKEMIPYLIGALVLFTGTTLPQIIYKIAGNV